MGADIDLVLKGELDITKFCATRSVSPRTAYVWCLERCTSPEQREKVKKMMQEYFATGAGLMEK
ncbi:MAG: hypothetical protein HYR97_00930 [Candidatus Melainabacteria bacterium]|nr:hypothetical protein [Candidatus Melainabacteria bacterium]